MMPDDGNIARLEHVARPRDDFDAMYRRLVQWGLCWIRAGGGKDVKLARKEVVEVEPGVHRILLTHYAEPDPDKKPRKWTPKERRAAEQLNSRVIRLPFTHRTVLQVFFTEDIAQDFDIWPTDKKIQIIHDLTHWQLRPWGVNRRIANYNRDLGLHIPTIWPSHFLPIRDEGIRMLCNQERA